MSGQAYTGRARAWLQLVRPPNLFTVPGDPLAGYFLAFAGTDIAWAAVLPCVAASLLLYVGGLILNDVADVNEDSRERPDRPIPSGKVGRGPAALAGAGTCCAGLAAASIAGAFSLVVASLLLLLIVTYTFGTRKVPALGNINMGLCRSVSVLLGASPAGLEAMSSFPVKSAAVGIGSFIVTVCIIARRETEERRLTWEALTPSVAVGLFMALACHWPILLNAVPLLICGVALFASIQCSTHLLGVNAPRQVAQAVGRLIRCLLPIQAACCATSSSPNGLAMAALLLLLWPLSSLASKKFYAS